MKELFYTKAWFFDPPKLQNVFFMKYQFVAKLMVSKSACGDKF